MARSPTDQPARAHPRSRGEHEPIDVEVVGETGSSPLTRGAHTKATEANSKAGLIPAHAGSTGNDCVEHFERGAHPRSRGEHALLLLDLTLRQGSSPLTRGAHHKPVGVGGEPGLIPAHAGSTGRKVTTQRPERAHPRSRGEHRSTTVDQITYSGSSPLTRGARGDVGQGRADRGLIPAHAGSTSR